MTYDIHPEAPPSAVERARRLHEVAVNQLDVATDHVLFTAHADGTVTGEVGPDAIS